MPPSKPSGPLVPQRIAKLLARAGIASRREIERMIADGRVALDGKVLDTPATVLPSLQGVTVDGNPVEAAAPARLFRYHKPAGLLTTERDPKGRPTIYDRLPKGLPRVVPVGRLDLSTEGLLLLTTDGELKRQLELPATGVERSYRARAYGNVTQARLEELMLGIEIEGIRYGPINANLERRTGANMWIELTLSEGKNREVRRVLEHLGLKVSRLIRTRYGPFHLGDLPVGDVDEVRASDLATFRTVLAKPGGGKTASALKFAVRERAINPPRHGEGDRSPKASGGGGAPQANRAEKTPASPDAKRPPRFDNRPGRGKSPAHRDDRVPDRATRPPERPTRTAPPARFTPRVTPPRSETGDSRPIAKPARAARARAHRETHGDTREPRPGDLADRPRPPRARGPAGGRGKPGTKPRRPPRTRK